MYTLYCTGTVLFSNSINHLFSLRTSAAWGNSEVLVWLQTEEMKNVTPLLVITVAYFSFHVCMFISPVICK